MDTQIRSLKHLFLVFIFPSVFKIKEVNGVLSMRLALLPLLATATAPFFRRNPMPCSFLAVTRTLLALAMTCINLTLILTTGKKSKSKTDLLHAFLIVVSCLLTEVFHSAIFMFNSKKIMSIWLFLAGVAILAKPIINYTL